MTALRPVKGWIPPKRWPTREEIGAHQARMARASASSTFLPTTLGTPTILDQLETSACFGFSFVQAVHIARQARGESSQIPSPMVPYWAGRREALSADQDVTDSGIDPDSMVAAANDFGCSSMAEDPFDPARINERPSDAALLAAQRLICTIEPILATGPDLWTAIQHVIAIERKPVLVALNVVPAFDNAGQTGDIVDDPSGPSRGGHANLLYGIEARGAKDANSWGVGEWTPDGTAILTPRFLAGAVMWAGALSPQVNP